MGEILGKLALGSLVIPQASGRWSISTQHKFRRRSIGSGGAGGGRNGGSTSMVLVFEDLFPEACRHRPLRFIRPVKGRCQRRACAGVDDDPHALLRRCMR